MVGEPDGPRGRGEGREGTGGDGASARSARRKRASVKDSRRSKKDRSDKQLKSAVAYARTREKLEVGGEREAEQGGMTANSSKPEPVRHEAARDGQSQ
eukprot:4134205-Pleurochrysis_carterae.AAC.2